MRATLAAGNGSAACDTGDSTNTCVAPGTAVAARWWQQLQLSSGQAVVVLHSCFAMQAVEHSQAAPDIGG